MTTSEHSSTSIPAVGAINLCSPLPAAGPVHAADILLSSVFRASSSDDWWCDQSQGSCLLQEPASREVMDYRDVNSLTLLLWSFADLLQKMPINVQKVQRFSDFADTVWMQQILA